MASEAERLRTVNADRMFRMSGLRPYGIAAAAVTAGTLIRFALDPWVGNHEPFLVFAFLVVGAAQAGGFRAGVVATILSVFVSDYFFVPPRHTLFVSDPRGDLIMLAIFTALCIALSAIVERLHQALARLRKANEILERERRDLQIANERFRMATEAANEAIWEWNLETGRTECTDSYAAEFGKPEGRYEEWLYDHVHPDDRDRVRNGLREAIAGRGGRWDSEYRLRHVEKGWADVRDRASIARNPDGTACRIMGAILDVTEARRIQQELEVRTRELARSNDDLQRFAFAASHDLQAPLRTMETYCFRLRARQNDTESGALIDPIVNAIGRMRTLVQDLLEFARVGSEDRGGAVRCDCNVILHLALEYLSSRIAESGAQITSDRLPVVMMNEIRLLRVLQNLVSNALKYCHGIPEIHISARPDDDQWVFSVRDNGIGIAPQYHDRIFGLFQRLHSESEYSGSGLGLPIVKRIVESAGGIIWVESDFGKGSTFYFTLPALEGIAAQSHRA